MARQKYINCDIYKRGVTVFLGSYGELLGWAKQVFTGDGYEDFLKTMEEAAPGGLADCHYGNGSCVVRLPDFPETAEEIADAAHELLHATFYVLGYSGVSFIEGDANEAFTYLLAWLTRNTLKQDGYEEVSDIQHSDTCKSDTDTKVKSNKSTLS